jgi:CRISPR-associated protein Cas1
MRNYYIMKPGRLSRKDNSLFYEVYDNGEVKRKQIPVSDVDSVFLFGETDLNVKALNFLSRNKISVHFFNYYGWYTGTFYPKEFLLSGDLLVKQSLCYTDDSHRLELGKELVEGAMYGMKQNLKRYKDRVGGLIDELERYKELIDQQYDIQSLMGIEGNGREVYYRAFPLIINQKVEFRKRVKHPPDNMMNAFISFMNGMIYAEILKEIYKTQLNPTVSFLHKPSCRRFSLALDIAEVFKPIYGDRIIFDLMNNNQITKDHFDKNLNYAYLKEKGREIVLKAFEEKLNTTIYHKELRRKVSYKKLIRLELFKLIKHILGEKRYKSLRIWW